MSDSDLTDSHLSGGKTADGKTRPPDRMLLAFGVLTAGGGLYFALVGAGALPPPSRTHAPGWVVMCCGLAFFGTGLAVLVRGWLGLDDQVRELPEDTPSALKALYSLSGLTALASLAGVGTWVAFGGGNRHFSISAPITGSLAEGIGRTVFGIGAILTWLMLIALARASAKKIFGKKN